MIFKMIKKNLIRIIIGFSIIGLSNSMAMSADNAEEKDSEIIVIGTSDISNGNVASARKEAISDALIKGIEGYLTRRLGSEGMINNFSRIIHDIIPAAGEETENFRILAEEQTQKHYKILVRIKINEEMMEERFKDMGFIFIKGPAIKVLFMVSQEDSFKGEVSYWWNNPDNDTDMTTTELVLHRIFQERGFSPINRVFNFPEESYSNEMKRLELSDEDIVSWGTLYSSDIVIYGSCKIVGRDLVRITLQSFETDNGSMLFLDSQVMEIDHDQKESDAVMFSIERVIDNISARLIPEVIRAIDEVKSGISKVDIELTGLRSFDQYKKFRNFLKKYVEGVESVVQTKIKPNTITVQVEFSGKREAFMNSMLNNDNFPYLVDVITKEDGGIIINIK